MLFQRLLMSRFSQAMVQMNGEWLGKRPMRINQANNNAARALDDGGGGGGGVMGGLGGGEAADPSNCTLYVGGVSAGTTEAQIREALHVIVPPFLFVPLFTFSSER